MENIIKDKAGRDITNVKKWMDMKPYETPRRAVIEEHWEISPAQAQKILDSMARNRNLRRSAVERYANEMLRGDWNEYASAISIDPEGHLIDGQHRMAAVIRAGITVPFIVRINVPSDTPFDIGVPRRAKDDLWMRGTLAADYCRQDVISLSNAILERALGQSAYRVLSNTEREKFLNVFGEECLQVIDITNRGQNAVCKAANVQAGAFAALLSGVPELTLREFFHIANSGYSCGEEQYAAITLHRYLVAKKQFNNASDKAMKCASTEQAIRDFVKGAPRQRIYTKMLFPYSDKIAPIVKEVMI